MTVPKPVSGAVTSVVMEWSPDQPASLTPSEMREYQAGRDTAFAALAAVAAPHRPNRKTRRAMQ